MEKVYLTRRNLQTLISKLDRVKAGEFSACTIIKHDTVHPKYPQTMEDIIITAIENDDYYIDRDPGAVLTVDQP